MGAGSFKFRNAPEPGATLVVKPTVLPDDSIRMQVQSRSAPNAGDRPAVDEAGLMMEPDRSALARIPAGQSLVVGGLLGENNEGTNLVMIVTPSYSMPEQKPPPRKPVARKDGPSPGFSPREP